MAPTKSVQEALALIENEPSKILGLTIGQLEVTPGLKIPKADAQSAPKVHFSNATGTYILINIDIDPPFPSFSFLGPALHWLQSGFKSQPTANGITTLSADETPFISNYAGPGPPPGSSPHRYLFLLYEEPEGFDPKKYAPAGGKNMGISGRIRYDLEGFVTKAGLGPVVAANFFLSN